MAILQYLKPINGLPDPRGSLATEVPSRDIAEAILNALVQSVHQEVRVGVKRGSYNKYSDADCVAIAKYASQHGAAAAARYFSRRLYVYTHMRVQVSLTSTIDKN